jgi:hypothetical protein
LSITVRELKDVRPPLLWEPDVGQETEAFIKRKHESAGIPVAALESVVFEARQILGRCVNPRSQPDGRTGLVVGYVQSGKTLSFTTLTALAQDNGFGLVILIAGVLNNLKGQTQTRLVQDLDAGEHSRWRPWLLLDNPTKNTAEAKSLQNTLKNWIDPEFPQHKKKVCLVTILKHSKRMGNLRKALAGVDLSKVPTLIIDDEADQATLNTHAAANRLKGENRKSSSYAEALELKSFFPHHTYVQYTATPQANLLINLVDELSPEFAELVTPGDGYVGGQTLFAPGARFVRTIPDEEASLTRAIGSSPPTSLVAALKVFLLTACANEVGQSRAIRTMMVHPSQKTEPHKDYLRWTQGLVDEWRGYFASKEKGLIDSFCAGLDSAYADLQGTVGADLPTLEELVLHLHVVLSTVVVREVNSTGSGSDKINWNLSEYWVLIGGAKLDRGFTVEGLVLTYMPRPLGEGNADSLQQRARFYGYKKNYLPYCRVYLQREVRVAFEEYVEHEQDLHQSIDRYRGYSLREWVRRFILHSSMAPTRKGVMGIPLREFLAAKWIEPKSAHVDEALVAHNRKVFEEFILALDEQAKRLVAHEAYPELYIDERRDSKHNVLLEEVSLVSVVEELLKRLTLGTEADEFSRVSSIVALEQLISQGEALVDVFLIANEGTQRRALRPGNAINQVAQGRQPAGLVAKDKLRYSGDRSFVTPNRVSLHLRYFDLMKSAEDKEIVATRVPWFALYFPESLQSRHLVQDD